MSSECYFLFAFLWFALSVAGCLFSRKPTTPLLAVLSVLVLAVVAVAWPIPVVAACLTHGAKTGFIEG